MSDAIASNDRLPRDAEEAWPPLASRANALLGALRVTRRLALIVGWTLPCLVIQTILVAASRRAALAFQRIYWRGMCAILGLTIRQVGTPAHRTADGRPVVFVSTHSSWLDVPVLGARLPAGFIAKEEVASWPVVSWIARLGRTVYVRRTRTSTARERDDMRARLADGDSLILFPEGTTSDGSRVMPFRSAFLSIAELPVTPDGRPPIVQPISLVYDRVGGLPLTRRTRWMTAWFGDMDLASHFLLIARERDLRATLLLHEPIDPTRYKSRKDLTNTLWHITATGAATLRQNRDAQPLRAPEGRG